MAFNMASLFTSLPSLFQRRGEEDLTPVILPEMTPRDAPITSQEGGDCVEDPVSELDKLSPLSKQQLLQLMARFSSQPLPRFYSLVIVEILRNHQRLVFKRVAQDQFPDPEALYKLAQGIVKANWKSQGIWREEWDGPEEPAKYSKWRHQDDSPDHRVQGSEASRPYHQFFHEMELERSYLAGLAGLYQEQLWTRGEANAMGLGTLPNDIYQAAYDNVRRQWEEQGIWHSDWTAVPGERWKHEMPYQMDDISAIRCSDNDNVQELLREMDSALAVGFSEAGRYHYDRIRVPWSQLEEIATGNVQTSHLFPEPAMSSLDAAAPDGKGALPAELEEELRAQLAATHAPRSRRRASRWSTAGEEPEQALARRSLRPSRSSTHRVGRRAQLREVARPSTSEAAAEAPLLAPEPAVFAQEPAMVPKSDPSFAIAAEPPPQETGEQDMANTEMLLLEERHEMARQHRLLQRRAARRRNFSR